MTIPLNFAIFGFDKANEVIKKCPHKKIIMMGHSLDRAMAAVYTSKHEDKVNGLVLLASYSKEEIKNTKTLSIYGSLDGIINMKNYKRNKENVKYLDEYVIEVGNHSYFGDYGIQLRDNKADIKRVKQINITSEYIINFIESLDL